MGGKRHRNHQHSVQITTQSKSKQQIIISKQTKTTIEISDIQNIEGIKHEEVIQGMKSIININPSLMRSQDISTGIIQGDRTMSKQEIQQLVSLNEMDADKVRAIQEMLGLKNDFNNIRKDVIKSFDQDGQQLNEQFQQRNGNLSTKIASNTSRSFNDQNLLPLILQLGKDQRNKNEQQLIEAQAKRIMNAENQREQQDLKSQKSLQQCSALLTYKVKDFKEKSYYQLDEEHCLHQFPKYDRSNTPSNKQYSYYHNNLFIDNPYEESRMKPQWQKMVYNINLPAIPSDTSTHLSSIRKRKLATLIDINRLRFTIYEDKNQLKCGSDFEKVLTENLLMSPDVKLHIHNQRELCLDLISIQYENTIKEKRSLVYGVLQFIQFIRRSLYYQLFKVVYLVPIDKQLSCWVIPNCDQQKFLQEIGAPQEYFTDEDCENTKRRKKKFINYLQKMYILFKDKMQKLIALHVLDQVFEGYQLFEVQKTQNCLDSDQKVGSPAEQFLDGFFFVFVLNDPLIRLFLQNQMDDHRYSIEYMLHLWNDYRQMNLTEWFNIMIDLKVFQMFSDESNEDGNIEFSKALWFQIKSLYIKQLEEFKMNGLNDDILGQKSYIKQTQKILSDLLKRKDISSQTSAPSSQPKFFSWKSLKYELDSYICQDCLTPQIPSAGFKGPLRTYIDRLNILNQLTRVNIDCQAFQSRELIVEITKNICIVISTPCVCEKHVALLRARRYKEKDEEVLEVRLINKKAMDSCTDESGLSDNEDSSCIQSRVDKVSIIKSLLEHQSENGPNESSKKQGCTGATFLLNESIIQDRSQLLLSCSDSNNNPNSQTNNEEAKKKKKKRKNKKKKKKGLESMADESSVPGSCSQDTEMKIDSTLNQNGQSPINDEEEIDYYDEDFEQDLKMFEQRLQEQTESENNFKLKPNISQDWLDKIRSEGGSAGVVNNNNGSSASQIQIFSPTQ